MKLKFAIIILLLSFTNNYGQENENPIEFSTLDSTIDILYSVISGDKGVERNKELFMSMFHPEAKLIATTTKDMAKALYFSPEDFSARNFDRMKEIGFYEREIYRVEESFGNIAHIWSTYEKDIHGNRSRGINSLQLMFDGARWWIVNLFWQDETGSNPLPEKYLPKD